MRSRSGAPQLFEHIPGNIVFDWDNDTGDAAATDAAFAKRCARRRARPRQQPHRGQLDGAAQRHRRLRSGKRPLDALYRDAGPHFVRNPLAEAVLKVPKEKLRLITPNVGGGFGMKAFVYPEQALVVWASRKLARPVKWQEDRSEGFVSDNQGRDHTTRPSSRSMRMVAFSACGSPSSPISGPISRRSAASSRRGRRISCPGSMRSGRSS